MDSRPRRACLVLDSAVPLPILSAVLDVLFNNFQTPMTSLLASAPMSSVSAGLRSALVVDMGWFETVVTSVYEYREVRSTRTVRGGKHLLDALYETLRGLVKGAGEAGSDTEERVVSFEECEDIAYRLMWCRRSSFNSSAGTPELLETVQEQDETEADTPQTAQTAGTVQVPLSSGVTQSTLEIPLEKLADVCDHAFFGAPSPETSFDDHDLPVHLLIYKHLLHIPIDTRAICMSRIVFTGGCSRILGIRERLMDDLRGLVDQRGWEVVWGKGVDQLRSTHRLRHDQSRPHGSETAAADEGVQHQGTADLLCPAANAGVEHDATEAKLLRNRPAAQQFQGQLRSLHSLGPWAGASLLCQLKVPAMATIDRELWLQQGPSGASRPSDVDVKPQQRQSMGPGGMLRASGVPHTNWTLGTWGSL